MSCFRRVPALCGLMLSAAACGSSEKPASETGSSSTSGSIGAGAGTPSSAQGTVTSGVTGVGGSGGSSGSSDTGGSANSGTTAAGGGGSGGTSTSSGGGSGGDTTTSASGGDTSTGGGGGTPEICSFTIAASPSSAIPTVGVVDWSTDLLGVTEARIDFELVEPQNGELNVGSGGPISATDSEAWLLGLKPEREYVYRITVSAGDTVCVSSEQSFTSGSITTLPPITRQAGPAADTQEVGFVVNGGYGSGAMIIDADGEVVWAVRAPLACSRAHMSWDGQYMWLMSANATVGEPAGGSNGHVVRLRMDGTAEEELAGFERAHHDFAVLPGGVAAFLMVVDDEHTGIVERSADGTLSTIVVLNEESYLSGGTATHPNALRYYERVDGYTVSDLGVSGVLQFDRQGTAQWQVGGYCSDPLEECETMNLAGTHGHQWLENGNLLVFLAGVGTNNLSQPDPVVEYSFAGSMTSANATLEWFYLETERSLIFGDAERLSNGNTLVTYSATGVIQEVTPAKELVQSLTGTNSLGYSSFRKTLYGPPQ